MEIIYLLNIAIYIFYISLVFCDEFTSASLNSDSLCGDSDWVAYKDEKCFKLIKEWSTFDEAQQICQIVRGQIDSFQPMLVTIKSAEEQEFLTNFVFETSGVKTSVWIGARRIENSTQFEWIDGSNLNYTNWIEGSPSGVVEKGCVEMQSRFTKQSYISNLNQQDINGLWKDMPCEKANYVLCQKLQTLSFPQLQKMLLDLREELKDKHDYLKTRLNSTENKLQLLEQNPVPKGFIYVQLYGQPDPTSLWPKLQWQQISSQYAGLFFRVEGGNSSGFGLLQQENSPRLTEVSFKTKVGNFSSQITPAGKWSGYIATGNYNKPNEVDGIRFYISGGEVRPRNQAMRIWKRIN